VPRRVHRTAAARRRTLHRVPAAITPSRAAPGTTPRSGARNGSSPLGVKIPRPVRARLGSAEGTRSRQVELPGGAAPLCGVQAFRAVHTGQRVAANARSANTSTTSNLSLCAGLVTVPKLTCMCERRRGIRGTDGGPRCVRADGERIARFGTWSPGCGGPFAAPGARPGGGAGHPPRIFVQCCGHAIDPGAVTLSTGMVNLRRFAQRPNESWWSASCWTPAAHRRDGPRCRGGLPRSSAPARRTGGSAARVRPAAPGWAGVARAVMDWSELTGLFAVRTDQGAEGLLACSRGCAPADVAAAMRELPEKRRLEVVDALHDERLADCFQELPSPTRRPAHLPWTTTGRRHSGGDGPGRRRRPARRAALAESDRFLELMEPEESAPVRRSCATRATRGRLDDPGTADPDPDAPCRGAGQVRNPDVPPAAGQHGVVCRPRRRPPPTGGTWAARTATATREPPSELVAGVLDDDWLGCTRTAPLSQVTRYFAA